MLKKSDTKKTMSVFISFFISVFISFFISFFITEDESSRGKGSGQPTKLGTQGHNRDTNTGGLLTKQGLQQR